MLSLSTGQVVDLCASRFQRARILTAYPEEHKFGHVAKIETHSAAVGATVLPDFVPDRVALVSEASRVHNLDAIVAGRAAMTSSRINLVRRTADSLKQ